MDKTDVPPRVGPGRLSALDARRGQRLVPLHAIPRRWAGKPWDAGPVGIASLVCPAGHGVKGRDRTEGMKKQGAGLWPPVSRVLAVLLALVLESAQCGGGSCFHIFK